MLKDEFVLGYNWDTSTFFSYNAYVDATLSVCKDGDLMLEGGSGPDQHCLFVPPSALAEWLRANGWKVEVPK